MSVSELTDVSRATSAKQGYPWPWADYSDRPEEMPLAGYATLLAAYLAAFGPLLGVLWTRNPTPPRAADVLLLGVATHKIGRIITKDWVTSPLRRAIGDLLTCPWCIAPWVASGLYALYLLDSRFARLLASGFASVAISDFLQHAYAAAASK